MGLTPLMLAVLGNQPDVVKGLLQNGCEVDQKALHYSVKSGSKEITEMLLQAGAKINVQSICGVTPLMLAAKRNHPDVVKLLLQHGCDIDKRDFDDKTALHYSAESGSKEITEMLLHGGAEINVQSSRQHSFRFILLESSGGKTPLMLAAKKNRPDVVKLLLQHGCDVAERDSDGKTALHYSAESGSKEITEMLLQAGAKINVQSSRDATPLMLALIGHHWDVLKVLLQHRQNNVRLQRHNVERKRNASLQRHTETMRIQEEFSHLEECRRNNHCGRKFSLLVERLIKIVEQSVLFQPAGIENLYTDELKQLQQLRAEYETQIRASNEAKNYQPLSCVNPDYDVPKYSGLSNQEWASLFMDLQIRDEKMKITTDSDSHKPELPKSQEEAPPDTYFSQVNKVSRCTGHSTPPPDDITTRMAQLHDICETKLDQLSGRLMERNVIDEDQLDLILEQEDNEKKVDCIRKILMARPTSEWEREFNWAFDYVLSI